MNIKDSLDAALGKKPGRTLPNTDSDTGGVKPMSIAGRTIHERERTSGMTPAERAWRKIWLQDQILTAREPILIDTTTPDLMNPIRRFYRWPLNTLFKKLVPVMGETNAFVARFYTGKAFMMIFIILGGTYYFKYGTNDWTRKGGWRVVKNRPAVYPGEPGFPSVTCKTHPSEYNDRGFRTSLLADKIRDEYGGPKNTFD